MADIGKIQRAISRAQAAGDTAAVQSLQQLLAEAQAAPGPKVETGRSLGQVAGEAVTNFRPSLANYGNDILAAVSDPVGTVKTLADLGAGGLREGAKAVLPTSVFNTLDSIGNQEAGQRASDVAIAVGRHYADRYGSVENFKRSLGQDPVGVLADLSLPVTGVGGVVAKAPGIAGRTGQIIQAVGRNLDPIAAVGNVARGSGRAVSALGGWASGVGDAPLSEAFTARRAGGVQEQRFLENMRDPNTRLADVVDEAAQGATDVRARGQAAYVNNIQSTANNTAPIDWRPIEQAFQRVVNSYTRGNRFIGGADAERMMQRVADLIQQYRHNPQLQTAWGLDALKQEISDLQVTPGPGMDRTTKNANRIATQVADAVRAEIGRVDPNYINTMRDYQNVQDLIDELERALKINNRASVDTTLRALQSTMRNNVQTNYGARTQLMDAIDPNRTIRAALAGQSLNSWAPRGIARAGSAAAIPVTIGAVLSNPALWLGTAAAAPLAMPRVVGEVAGLLGAGARKVDEAKSAAPQSVRSAVSAATGQGGRFVAQEAGGIANEADAMLEDAQGNVYDRKGRLIRRGQQ